jgi:predicted ATP-grasp superfamily ATP-dependent carboligase
MANAHDALRKLKLMSHEPLMIFGASTRAAAQSAVRADFRPFCADHFADEDLYELARVLPLSRYPQGLVAAASDDSDIRRVGQGLLGRGPTTSQNAGTVGQRPPTADSAHPTLRIPWMYTGALENHPRLLKKLAALRPLYGNPAEVVTRVRDPFAVARAFTNAGLPALRLCGGNQPPRRDGRWLIKPRRSAGGRGIQVWDNSAQAPPAARRDPCYFQQRARGESHSALYLATSAETVLIGVSRQLIGEPRLSAGPFAYCGSIGPVNLDEALQRQIVRYGEAIGSEFRLRGLFGIDFVVENDAVAWLTEVNPRYTASVEVFESALGISLLGDHVQASAEFDDSVRSQEIAGGLQDRLDAARRSSGGRKCGKAVIYAPFTLRAPGLTDFGHFEPISDHRVRIADRPRAGTVIPAQAPLCTLLIDDLKWQPKSPGSALTAFEPALSALLAGLEPKGET